MTLTLAVVPEKAVVIRRRKTIVSASWFGTGVIRPFIYPFRGPYDRDVTRLGHPGDPVGHSHHRGIFFAHHDVGGFDFWSEKRGVGRVVQRGVSDITAEGNAVSATLDLAWIGPAGQQLVREKRKLTFHDLRGGELALDVDMSFEAVKDPVVFGKTNFGLLGIRVARTMRVHEGLGGLIQNSNEGENETGCFGQHAGWVDYSGPVPLGFDPKAKRRTKLSEFATSMPATIVGIACFDHPQNSEGDTAWHVRDDGWMGPGWTRDAPRTLKPGSPLRARYHLLAHRGRPWDADVATRYRGWRQRVTGTSRG